jgi:hypothetical protein
MTKELGPMRNLRTRGVTLATALTLVFAGTSMAHASDGDAATLTEVTAAIAQTDAREGTLVADAAPSITYSDSAAQTANVDVPVDPAKGVTLSGPSGHKLTIGLPNAKHAGKGVKGKNGMVAYGGKNGSANASVPTVEGGAQQLVYIKNRKAATSYDFTLGLPAGGQLKLAPGGTAAAVLDHQGSPVFMASAPWGRDANNRMIQTAYTVKGNVLTQHVAHNVAGVKYPVVADPVWVPVSAAVVVAAFTAGVYACGLGYLAGMAWQIFWNGWVWQEVRRAGSEGCVEGVVARFFPVAWFRALIKR